MKQSQVIEEEQLSEIPNLHPIVLYELVHRLKKTSNVSWKDLLDIANRESNMRRNEATDVEKIKLMDQCRESLRETIAEAKARPLLSSQSSQEINHSSNLASRLRLRSSQDFDTERGLNKKLSQPELAKSTDISNSNIFLQQPKQGQKQSFLSSNNDSEDGKGVNAHLK